MPQGLHIPQRKTSASAFPGGGKAPISHEPEQETPDQWKLNPWKWVQSKWSQWKWKYLLLTLDQCRWPVQVGAAAGLCCLLLIFVPPAGEFFSSSAIMAPVTVVIIIEATAGDVLRRGYITAFFGSSAAMLAFGLLWAATGDFQRVRGTPTSYFIFLCAIGLCIPAAIIRHMNPHLNVGINFGLSTAETVLLAGYADTSIAHPWEWSWKRALASIIGPCCAVLAGQFIMRKAARPTAANSLASILRTMGEVLEGLASSVGPYGSHFHFSSASALVLHSSDYRPAYNPSRLKGNSVYGHGRQRGHEGVNASAPISEGEKASHETRIADGAPFTHYSRHHVIVVSEAERRQIDRMMQNIESCQTKLDAQTALISSAKQEISCRKPYRFPAKEYEAILEEIRQFFFHIASLVFSLNLYLSAAVSPADQRGDPSFVAVTKTRSHPAMSTLVPPKVERSHRHSRFHRESLSHPTGEGDHAIMSSIAWYFATALRHTASALENRHFVGVAVRHSIQKASEGLNELELHREKQRKAFGQILMMTLEADLRGNIHPFLEETPDWQTAIGTTSTNFSNLTSSEKALHWEAYWLARDRRSTSFSALEAIRDGLNRLCDVVDNYVAIAPLKPGTPIIQLMP